ncbi:MAG: hypothetical protein LUQ04_01770 [Methanoregula sp.]|nr:hypothetical protein [Methanoregula sp.]
MTKPGSVNRRSFFPLVGTFLFLLILLPVSVFAQGPVDLTFGATGTFPWNISGILPGDHGSDAIELHNNGTENGIVYLWVDNISQSDRYGNPGGGLADYLYFNVSHQHINSTVILPAHITSFPPAPQLRDHFIIVDSFNAGDTIRLNWTWEFEETGQPQNDAQGNTLRFNISYTLVNLPTPALSLHGSGSRIISYTGPFRIQNDTTRELTPVPSLNLSQPGQGTPETAKTQPVPPDYRVIIILASIIIILVAILYFRRQKHH